MSIESNHMLRHPQNAGNLVKFDERYGEYYLLISKRSGVERRQAITHCPWCGETLPHTLRNKWFDELEALGIDPLVDEIPEAFKSSHWQRGGK